MKKLILALAIFSSTMTTHAYGFVPNMQFFVNHDVAIVRVFNTSYAPVICSGQAFGHTVYGNVMNAWVSNLTIAPGQWTNVYVYTNYYNPFVRASASIYCQQW